MAFKTLIVIPTFLEESNVAILIPRIFNNLEDVDILIVDDNSPDQTCEVIRKFQKKYPNLYLIERKNKMGVASAYIEGYLWGISRNYQYLGQMDADLSHRVRDLKNLISGLGNRNNIGLVIGSRWVENGKTEKWSMKRRMLSKFGNKYIRFMLNLKINDITAGFRIYSNEVLKKMNFETIQSRGFAFQVEMLRKMVEANITIIEIPITFREREFGKSKITLGIILEAYVYVTAIGIKHKLSKILPRQ